MIDEAGHMFDSIGGSAYMRSLDSLKSMANISGTTMVLFGAYDLVTPLGPQLSRRFKVVHFSRYNYEVEADRFAFEESLATMQAQMPLSNPPDLLSHVEDIYVACVGCVGIAHTYLRQALAAACERHLRSVTWELIKEFIDWKKVIEWNEAASIGELDLARTSSLKEAKAAVLGSAQTSEVPPATKPDRRRHKTGLRPGQRAVHRDVVEPDYAASP
jgi:hypothetical protein